MRRRIHRGSSHGAVLYSFHNSRYNRFLQRTSSRGAGNTGSVACMQRRILVCHPADSSARKSVERSEFIANYFKLMVDGCLVGEQVLCPGWICCCGLGRRCSAY